MRYVSTRGGGEPILLGDALMRGIAPDGGLYMPEHWPRVSVDVARGALPDVAATVLRDFFAEDALASALEEITAEAFSFPAPLVPIENSDASVLELFHGPTAAFKDFGARFLAACMARVERADPRPLHILVATSGDTGGAVAAAFHNRPNVRVSVLYPKGMVSPSQERQLTCWGGNVQAVALLGVFDDCQRLVKQALADPVLSERFALSSANSINIARLLPQMTYFAATSLAIQREYGVPASFVVPSGNLGHVTACVWARAIGLPIDQIVLAHNANRTMPDYLTSGVWTPRPTVQTLASAMDVGDPSNGERLRYMYPRVEDLRAAVTAYVIDDEAIADRIKAGFERHGQIWCPHTAAAAEAFERHTQRGAGRWVIVSTAHAAKFTEIVEPLIGRAVETPPALRALPPAKPTIELTPSIEKLRAALT